MKEIGKYLAVMYKRDELVKNKVISCIPKRQVEIDGKSRKDPTIAYLDSDTYTRTSKVVKEKGVPKWNWTRVKEPCKIQKKRMIAMALVVTMRNVLENHLYVFNGVL